MLTILAAHHVAMLPDFRRLAQLPAVTLIRELGPPVDWDEELPDQVRWIDFDVPSAGRVRFQYRWTELPAEVGQLIKCYSIRLSSIQFPASAAQVANYFGNASDFLPVPDGFEVRKGVAQPIAERVVQLQAGSQVLLSKTVPDLPQWKAGVNPFHALTSGEAIPIGTIRDVSWRGGAGQSKLSGSALQVKRTHSTEFGFDQYVSIQVPGLDSNVDYELSFEAKSSSRAQLAVSIRTFNGPLIFAVHEVPLPPLGEEWEPVRFRFQLPFALPRLSVIALGIGLQPADITMRSVRIREVLPQ